MKMWGWELETPRKLTYKQVDIPKCNDRQVLVKMITACICNGSDPNMFYGHKAYTTPYIFGHEPFGEIIEAGCEIKDFHVGDKVSWWCSIGAFAQYCAVSPFDVAMIIIPDCIDKSEAPIMELAIAASRAVKANNIHAQSRLLILGMGPSGLVMAQRAKALGCAFVAGWDLYNNRREIGLSGSFDIALDPRNPGTDQKTIEYGEFDIVIDAMGDDMLPHDGGTLSRAIRLLKYGGKIISYGHPEHNRIFCPFDFQVRNLIMEAPENDMNKIRIIAEETKQFIVEKKLNIKQFVSMVIPLKDADKALFLSMTEPDKHLKIILSCDD